MVDAVVVVKTTKMVGRGGGHNNGQNGGTKPPIQYTKYTGPQMAMAAPMIFSSDDWKNKLPQAQRDKLKELKIRAKSKTQSNNHNSTPSSTYNANATQSQPSPPADPPVPGNNLRQMLSNSHSHAPTQINTVHCTYSINRVDIQSSGALIDGGSNGGLGGSDVRVLWETYSTADVTGIGGKSFTNLPICTVGAVIQTNKGPIIGVFNQYAYYGKGQTVHSVNHLKHFGIIVDDSPRQFAHGKQRLKTPEGYFIPISIRNGLPYIDMHPPTDEELEAYPQVNFTLDMPWEPQDVTDLDLSV
jgi:hypothetical protein